MATAKKPKVSKPKVKKEAPGTPEEQQLGQVIIYAARMRFGSTRLNDKTLKAEEKRAIFLDSYGNAAKEQGYRNYLDLPEGTRKFISWLGGRNSHKHDPKVDPKAKAAKSVSPMEERWWEEMAENPALRHGLLHPEDDKELIDEFAKQ
jgi:hypothetical protein